ncbi:MAG TPA: hypothetical protein VFS16_07550 [Acidimicrobiia bacterium]|nr:hypothetical protein [Acidimicrobiia bacterium]
MTDSNSDPRDTVGQDPQKGRKPGATPAGVNRIDMAEDGPQMAQTPGGNVGIEHDTPDAFGEPGDVAPDRRSTPAAGEESPRS